MNIISPGTATKVHGEGILDQVFAWWLLSPPNYKLPLHMNLSPELK
jgi:hypothetical protein